MVLAHTDMYVPGLMTIYCRVNACWMYNVIGWNLAQSRYYYQACSMCDMISLDWPISNEYSESQIYLEWIWKHEKTETCIRHMLTLHAKLLQGLKEYAFCLYIMYVIFGRFHIKMQLLLNQDILEDFRGRGHFIPHLWRCHGVVVQSFDSQSKGWGFESQPSTYVLWHDTS